MRVLQLDSQGDDVKKWQLFLRGQGFDPGPADGDFGPRTHKATLQFQVRYDLSADGVVGLKTLGQAMKLGFEAIDLTPDGTAPSHRDDPDWPPRPNFDPLTSTTARQQTFGRFAFEAQPVPGNPENIRITDDWEDRNIVRIEIPQLRGISGAPSSANVRFHRLAAAQLRALWSDWERAGLLPLILTWDGSFVPRFVRGSTTNLSNHSFGSAFDINAAWNALGTRPALSGRKGSVRELVELANRNGFFWGGHFRDRADGMHFEIARLS